MCSFLFFSPFSCVLLLVSVTHFFISFLMDHLVFALLYNIPCFPYYMVLSLYIYRCNLCVRTCVCYHFFLPVCAYLYLNIMYLSICLSVSPSIYLSISLYFPLSCFSPTPMSLELLLLLPLWKYILVDLLNLNAIKSSVRSLRGEMIMQELLCMIILAAGTVMPKVGLSECKWKYRIGGKYWSFDGED